MKKELKPSYIVDVIRSLHTEDGIDYRNLVEGILPLHSIHILELEMTVQILEEYLTASTMPEKEKEQIRKEILEKTYRIENHRDLYPEYYL